MPSSIWKEQFAKKLRKKCGTQTPMIGMDKLRVLSLIKVHFAAGIRKPQSAVDAVECVSSILDAKCAPVSQEKILDNSLHLTDA